MIPRQTPLRRKAPMKRAKAGRGSSSPGSRKPRKGLPRRNPKRAASAFAFAYHSRDRKRFVKSLGCVYCTMLSPFFGLATAGTCDNAHTGKKPGKGLKSHYTTIVPLCRSHHRMYDEREKMFGTPEVRAAIESCAEEVERMWRRHLAAVGPTPQEDRETNAVPRSSTFNTRTST